MARHLRAALAQVKARALGRLPVDVDQLARDAGHRWRDRKLTPAVTLGLFMLQVLHGNVAITALRHVGNMAASASSYCEARARLPLTLFAQLFDAVARQAARLQPPVNAVTVAELTARLLKCDMPYCCPEGRPTLIQISFHELARKFGKR